VSSVLTVKPLLKGGAGSSDSSYADVVCRDRSVLDVSCYADTHVWIRADGINTSVLTFRYASAALQIRNIFLVPRFACACVW
jgi:hypothetical protein